MPDDTVSPDLPDRDDRSGVRDARDERLAGRLAVDPLDDVTRRRLVATALRSTGSAKRARRLVAAAAFVLLAVVGAGAVVAIRGTRSDQVAADRHGAVTQHDRSANADGSADAKAGSRSAAAATTTSPTELGDFGELAIAANRQRLVAAAAAAATGAADSDTAFEQLGPLAARKLADLDCSVQGLPSGTVTALGTGTLDATAVVVVVTTTPGGTRVISTVDTGTCRVRPLS